VPSGGKERFRESLLQLGNPSTGEEGSVRPKEYEKGERRDTLQKKKDYMGENSAAALKGEGNIHISGRRSGAKRPSFAKG